MLLTALRRIYAFLIDALETILLVGAVFLVIYVFLFRPFEVKGDSMYPNFHDGEYVLTNLIGYGTTSFLKLSGPKKGDVIVFKSPTEADKDFIKRVIALPGETVSLNNGNIYVNGRFVSEDEFLSPDVTTNPQSFLREEQSVTVPQDQYFVMGDNRPYSSDSREWGFVGKKNIIGTSFLIYWPLSKFGRVSNPY
ncbi:MAG: signal peptidase I [Candidatus Levybacteria bacterium RIFCSPLOWO2_02_FULL_40_18]|nr:MAG: Signal peptidase I [Candidatus Levybacteria bacterium GW2011_GWB1_41_21]OGH21022.1 MAG: signal peptidase I [Candidatus Levybacteria bacterium RIFCSPHIGHO2_01_FULL_40_83]OGH32325.1 MAG: signal peptidase I [Candidatus Levybacteria bacterium RIFCSPHIGHO2_12_FULL_40_44]OGH41747.1 MAG: signal peptidase I [Candidatus Levybacteria bacterium RIFCSPLOWO2_01_FULL_40_96]OGH50295.1 MAG: signal peptidase I [Candidatus Levybacteria bacterium RIFCSPLOWO2_02_FULL_40_18]OGH54589.1 MAG: signal peptidase